MAELLASISEASYLPPVDVDPNFRTLGFKQVMPVVDGSMIGYVASADDVTVVVFRGPDNDIDWIVNLAVGSVQTPNGPIHSGFYNAYQPLKPQIVKLLKASNPKHLWITGHSLGGALAVVCAHDLTENENLHLDGVITFGQPMVAKMQLAKYLDTALLGRFAHYMNGNDIVARVPPNFSHFGSLVWFTDNGVKRSKPKRMAFMPRFVIIATESNERDRRCSSGRSFPGRVLGHHTFL
jgi:triacylglycerol lipase